MLIPERLKKNRWMTRFVFTQGHPEYSRGMTYVELIVVLSIFSVMTSIALFNYNDFQVKVDIKNLANDIALKVVEAQKSSLSGKLLTKIVGISWKSSYGVYFDTATSTDFIYFADIDQGKTFSDTPSPFCAPVSSTLECVEKYSITKGNFVSNITIYYLDSTPTWISTPGAPIKLDLTFTRPNSGPIIVANSIIQLQVSYVQITISSPSGVSLAKIKVYPSGRIQIN